MSLFCSLINKKIINLRQPIKSTLKLTLLNFEKKKSSIVGRVDLVLERYTSTANRSWLP